MNGVSFVGDLATFLLRCRERGASAASADADAQEYFGRWLAWLGSLSRGGHFKQIHGTSPSRTVKGRSRVVIDGLPLSPPTPPGGLLLVSATDIADAVELAKGCPVLEREGTVEVWPVQG
jgi:hypothetical protein